MRLIDADALIEYLKKMWSKWDEDDWYEAQAKDAMKDDIEIVNKQPTVDAVPVVRCGECGHYHSEDDPAFCDELCTIHIDKTDGCLRGIKRGGKVGYRAADGERKDGAV